MLFIAVVSHGHFHLIKKLGCLSTLAARENIQVCLLDNLGEDQFPEWCRKNNISYLTNNNPKGFGENNNIIFNSLSLGVNDYFLVMNPDVVISYEMIYQAVFCAMEQSKELICINLFRDEQYSVYDPSVRHFPGFLDFVKSFLRFGNGTIIDKGKITDPISVDWASGSFLLFSSSLYRRLGGFDVRYFMYCEDIDICYRAKYEFAVCVWYYPNIMAVHQAAHANRRLFSRHFKWHISSVFKFLMLRYGLRK